MNVTEMKQKRAGLVNQMRALLNTAEAAKRDLTADEQTTYANMEKEVDQIGAQVEREERLARVETDLRNQRDSNYRPNADQRNAETDTRPNASAGYRKAFFDGLVRRKGINSVGADYFAVLSSGSDTEGGFLVPTITETEIIKKVYEQNPIRQFATVRSTSLDVAIPVRTGIPTFAWRAENGKYGKSQSKYGRVALHNWDCGGIIPISEELLRDTPQNMEAEIVETAGLAFGELESAAFMSGDGVGKPFGLFTQDKVSEDTIGTEETAANNAITSDELIDIQEKLTSPYQGNARWVFNPSIRKALRKLKNSVTGDYLWQPGLQAGQADMLLGKPVLSLKDAPALAAGVKVICYGDLRAYRIQDRLGTTMKVLNELYAEDGQIGYRFNRRLDAKLTDANAVVFLKMKA
jgi:HK97 family phage major capsid protein